MTFSTLRKHFWGFWPFWHFYQGHGIPTRDKFLRSWYSPLFMIWLRQWGTIRSWASNSSFLSQEHQGASLAYLEAQQGYFLERGRGVTERGGERFWELLSTSQHFLEHFVGCAKSWAFFSQKFLRFHFVRSVKLGKWVQGPPHRGYTDAKSTLNWR